GEEGRRDQEAGRGKEAGRAQGEEAGAPRHPGKEGQRAPRRGLAGVLKPNPHSYRTSGASAPVVFSGACNCFARSAQCLTFAKGAGSKVTGITLRRKA